ncbi:glutathione S-transferase N-terminal domain-containing protein [Chamaesiphon sp. VAR_48_metabat_135_sub]|uniref:glutathione S-transferase N-terminal domain-containing protein n=1 Tax=Chamaesiphon sp. VAR_48_metabat_135_sub TaxID=2964699 RepID=UPI00286A5DDE|nr:glutathione S-transferase N-terminal domain-containing protein [Chamaesiphon sp. VAR_48_metabat_135_sub]
MMKLYYSVTSPYARKVLVLIQEKGLGDRVDLTLCNPFADVEKLQRVNPLRKIPVLILDDGSSLYDSPVICEYLDSLGGVPRLRALQVDSLQENRDIPMIPTTGIDRFNVLRQQAIADGIMDAAIAIVMETRRTDAEQSTAWINRWATAINASLDVLETEIQNSDDNIDVGKITIGCALGYLDFRLSDLHWRNERGYLTKWFDRFVTRKSMKQTVPID